MGRVWRWRHSAPLVVIVGFVVAANALYLFGILDPNPLNLLTGLADITHPGPLPGMPWLDPNTGITSQALGHLVAQDWLHGHVPWWNPYEGTGSPLAGEMQSGALFPPMLLLAWSHGQILLHTLLELTAGTATYAFLSELRLGRLAATAGGVVFALGGAYAWFSHAPIDPVCFLPVLLLGIERAVTRGQGWLVLALGLALSIYAGFPETAYIDGVLVAVYAVTRLATLPGDRRRAFVVHVAGGLGLGVLLAAPILVPFVDYLPSANLGAGHHGLFGRVSLPKAGASQVFLPYVFGPIDAYTDPKLTVMNIWLNNGGYLGIPVVVLGSIGAVSRRHRVLSIVLVVWLVLALGRTFGLDGPLQLINLIPGMKDVAFYRYSDSSWTMAAVILAAIGLEDVVQRVASPRRIALAGGFGLVVVALSWLGAHRLLTQVAGDIAPWEHASLAWGLGVVVAITAAGLLLRRRWRGYAIAAVLTVDALGMFIVPQLSAPQSAAYYPQPAQYLAAHLGSARFYTVGPINPNYGSYFGISSLGQSDLPEPKLYDDYVVDHLKLQLGEGLSPAAAVQQFLTHLPAFEQAGVRYLVTPGGFTLPSIPQSQNLRLVFSGPSGDIFELRRPGSLYASTGCRLAGPQLDQVVATCARAGTLVRRETSMAGWTATVDGRVTPITTVGSFQRVDVPAGRSTVVFTFTPPHLDLALVAFGIGLVLAAGVPLAARRRRRQTNAR